MILGFHPFLVVLGLLLVRLVQNALGLLEVLIDPIDKQHNISIWLVYSFKSHSYNEMVAY